MLVSVMLLVETVAAVRRSATSVLSPQLPSEHAADVRASATHCRWTAIHEVSGVGECGDVTSTSQRRSC